jgi:hypothetical protein
MAAFARAGGENEPTSIIRGLLPLSTGGRGFGNGMSPLLTGGSGCGNARLRQVHNPSAER